MPRPVKTDPEYPEKHAEQLGALYNELGDRRLFTEEVLRGATDAYDTLSPDNPTCSLVNSKGEVHHGFEHDVELLKLPRGVCDAKKKVTIKFLTYLEIATNLDSWQPRSVVKSEAPKTLETCYKLVKARIPIYVLEWEYSQKPLREDDLIEAKAIWINSPIRKQILDSLIEARSQFKPVKVTKIVCLGQGPLYMVNMKERDRPGWNLDHHLIAFDIAKKLEELDGQYPEIVFQDPSYMQQDHDWLSNKVEETRKVHVRFAENPRGIFEVDKNTLVLAHCSPSFPVRQIIVDWTKDFGGPAGFFCRTIPEIPDIEAEITHCREASPDHANRYVASMAKDYNMRSVCEVPAWSSTLYIKQA